MIIAEKESLVIEKHPLWIITPYNWPLLFRRESNEPMRLCYIHWIIMILSAVGLLLWPKIGSIFQRFQYMTGFWVFIIGLYMIMRPDKWIPKKQEERNLFSDSYDQEKAAAYKYNLTTTIFIWLSFVLIVGLKFII